MSQPYETDRIRKALADLAQSVAELMIDNAIAFDEDDDTGELAMRGMLNNACDALGWTRPAIDKTEGNQP